MFKDPRYGLSLMVWAPLLSASLCACVPYERARPSDSSRFELLYTRQLSAFEQRLATEEQTGARDGWTRVGQAWVALSSCSPLAQAPFEGLEQVDPLAKVIMASLNLEATRRARLVHHKGTGFRAISVTGTMHAELDDADFFERGESKYGDELVVWPQAQEAWADELPASVPIPSQCDKFYKEIFEQGRAERAAWDKQELIWRRLRALDPAEQPSVPPPRSQLNLSPAPDAPLPAAKTLAAWQAQELAQVEALLAAASELDASTRATPSVDGMLWRVRYHQAMLFGELGLQLDALDKPTLTELEHRRAWYIKSRMALLPLAQRELEGQPAPVEPALRAFVLAIYGDWLYGQDKLEPALAAFAMAESLGLDARNRELGRYLYVRALSRAGQWEQVVAFADRLPAISSRYYPAMTYRIAYALRRLGRSDEFMAMALKVFRDRPYQADPFLRALYVQILQVITDYPFEVRTAELIEDLGPRSLIYERMDEYATVALDRGKPENARAAASWLLAKHSNANFYPRYHALLALASFLEDDPEAFVKHLGDVTKRPAQVVEAISAQRQATFFAGADAQLARVFRQMLPTMAEWGDGPKAREARQRWLALIMERAQDFVRQSPGSIARPELIELYRLASAMLDDDQPRAYPERVGATEPAPLVLGTVRVEDRDLAPYEPQGTFEGVIMSSLTLLPRDVEPLERWTPFWGVAPFGEEREQGPPQAQETP